MRKTGWLRVISTSARIPARMESLEAICLGIAWVVLGRVNLSVPGSHGTSGDPITYSEQALTRKICLQTNLDPENGIWTSREAARSLARHVLYTCIDTLPPSSSSLPFIPSRPNSLEYLLSDNPARNLSPVLQRDGTDNGKYRRGQDDSKSRRLEVLGL